MMFSIKKTFSFLNEKGIILLLLILVYFYFIFYIKKSFEYFLDITDNNNDTEKLVKNTLILHYLCKDIYVENNELYNITNINKPKSDATLNNTNMVDRYDKYKYDFSLSFFSVNDYVTLPPIKLDKNGFTICFFMMMKTSDKGTNYANVFDFGNQPNDDNLTLQLFENNIDNHFSIFYDRKLYKASFLLCNFELDEWFHFAIVINPEYWTLYFNGNPINISVTDFVYPAIHTRLFNYIGKNNSEDFSSGTFIDDFRVYNSPLTIDEIKEII